MTLHRNNKTLTAFVLLGIICALILCGIRIGHEVKYTDVMLFMSTSDVELLSTESGYDVNEYTQILSDAGYVISDEIPLNGAVGLVEDMNQYSYNPIAGFDASSYDGSMVRVFELIPKYAAKYAVLGYGGAQEIENILYRAATDRNIRILWVTPFTHSVSDKIIISDPDEYTEVAANLKQRITSHGLNLGDQFSVMEKYEPSPLLEIGVFMGICGACGFLCLSLFKKFNPLLMIPAAIACVAAYYVVPNLSISLFALLASIAFPCLALWYLADSLSAARNVPSSKAVVYYLKTILIAISISILGGLVVSATLSSSNYLLAVYNFRGVKLSQMAPIAFAVYIIFRKLYGGNGIKGIAKEILSGSKFIILLIAIALVGGLLIFILRTGDGLLSVGVFEQRFRNLLENFFIARPRTKEFLIAWPCLAVAVGLIISGWKRYAWPFAILTAPGLSSIVNTYCHSRSSIWLSTTRSVLGAIVGIAIGIIILLFLCSFKKSEKN